MSVKQDTLQKAYKDWEKALVIMEKAQAKLTPNLSQSLYDKYYKQYLQANKNLNKAKNKYFALQTKNPSQTQMSVKQKNPKLSMQTRRSLERNVLLTISRQGKKQIVNELTELIEKAKKRKHEQDIIELSYALAFAKQQKNPSQSQIAKNGDHLYTIKKWNARNRDYTNELGSVRALDTLQALSLAARKFNVEMRDIVAIKYKATDYSKRPPLGKEYNPSQSQIAKCRKVLRESETKRELPTISHYREMDNPSDKKLKELVIKIINKYPQIKRQGLNSNNIRILSNDEILKLAEYSHLGTHINNQAQAEINKRNREYKYGVKENATSKNPHPLSTILYADKSKLLRLRTQLKNTPRNETAKRENLKVSIAMVKESIKRYEKIIRNSKTAIQKNVVGTPNYKVIRFDFSSWLNAGTATYYDQKIDKDITFDFIINDKRLQTNANIPQIIEHKILRLAERQRLRELKNPKTKILKSKNFTNADFKKHLTDTVRKHSEMFGGKYHGIKHNLMVSDLTPTEGITELGKLAFIQVKRNGKLIPIKFNGNSTLLMDIRRNLHTGGSDARIKNVTIKGSGLAEVGKLVRIDYIKAKSHLNNGLTTLWFHKLSEVTKKDHPTLFLDKDNFPIIVNGNYDVWDVGIVN